MEIEIETETETEIALLLLLHSTQQRTKKQQSDKGFLVSDCSAAAADHVIQLYVLQAHSNSEYKNCSFCRTKVEISLKYNL